MTDNEMQRMQQEAVRRAQEMQRRAAAYHRQPSARVRAQEVQQYSEQPSVKMPVQDIKHSEQPCAEATVQMQEVPEKPDDGHERHRTSGGIFETLFKDKEKTLILGILLLLMDEKTDNSLLMALVYLLL